jgi:hypothetical protein
MPTRSFSNPHDQQRTVILEQIIKESFLGFGRPVPERTVLTSMVGAWDPVLAEIPTEYLYEMYLSAMREHKGSAGLIVSELAQAWQEHVMREMMEGNFEHTDF